MFSDSVKYPLISVISVSYNCVNGVDATIDSLVKQIYPNIEYIVSPLDMLGLYQC